MDTNAIATWPTGASSAPAATVRLTERRKRASDGGRGGTKDSGRDEGQQMGGLERGGVLQADSDLVSGK